MKSFACCLVSNACEACGVPAEGAKDESSPLRVSVSPVDSADTLAPDCVANDALLLVMRYWPQNAGRLDSCLVQSEEC